MIGPRGPRRAVALGLAAFVALSLLAGCLASGLIGTSGPGTRPVFALGLGGRQRLGPLRGDRTLRLALVLAGRNHAELQRLIGAGRSVSPIRFARAFLPPPEAVHAGIRQLQRAGVRAAWSPGSTVIEAVGHVSAVEGALGVAIDRFRRSDSRSFYAPVSAPRFRGALRGLVSTVSGLSDERRVQNLDRPAATSPGCGTEAGGYTPNQVLSAYNFEPLRRAQLSGAGQTVVFIETDTFRPGDLECFRQRFGLPAFNLSVAPERWGSPSQTPASGSGASESDLDLEVVHATAPQARLVVYYTDGTVGAVAAAFASAVQAHPTAIMSVSLGSCEIEGTDSSGNPAASPDQTVWHAALERLAATGGSAFIASGDSGAFECGSHFRDPSSGAELPLVSFPASDPYATAVGGTTLFLGAGNAYAGEATWGSPFEATGTGGGLSAIWPLPSWQTGPGVHTANSTGRRQVPDVAALGDPSTGWDIFQAGSWGVVGGTSAAAPLWAALTALGDEALGRLHLAPVGFANPPLYSLGRAASHFPAPAYNDVTRGENLYYTATPGWDLATGWGSPNAAGLVNDLVAYRKGRR